MMRISQILSQRIQLMRPESNLIKIKLIINLLKIEMLTEIKSMKCKKMRQEIEGMMLIRKSWMIKTRTRKILKINKSKIRKESNSKTRTIEVKLKSQQDSTLTAMIEIKNWLI